MQVDPGVDRHGNVTVDLPMSWLLSIGADLVTDLVDVWQPDAVSIDCDELLDPVRRPGVAYPVIGFVSWLSDSVVDPAHLPDAPLQQRYGSGTLIGIDPGSDHPLDDATVLAESVYQKHILSMIPFVQEQPIGL
jgi:hypothetical protein